MASDLPIFVYGSLKRGFPNFKYMPAGTTFLHTAVTVEPYPLVVGPHMIPFLLDSPGHSGAFRVQGELFAATPESLAFLDQFEGTEKRFYRRVVVQVAGDEDAGQCTRAWTYVRHPEEGGPPFMREWSSARLELQEFISSYTLEIVERGFVPRDER